MNIDRYLRRLILVLGCLLAGFNTQVFAATIDVSTVSALNAAVAQVNNSGGNSTIRIADGTYTLGATLYINAPGVTIESQSGNRDAVIIQGDAMSASAVVKDLIRVTGDNFKIQNLTLRRCGWHLLQIAGEQDADNAVIRNVVFRDAYEQLLKVSIDQSNYAVTGDGGLIEDSLFEYTAGIGPQYYIGGIDIHGGKNWIIRRNTFRDIISPSQEVAEFAIHMWNQTANALVEKNIIIDCDRAIGFGLDNRGNSGGIIRNNVIYHAANKGQYADAAIYLELSPDTQIYNNTIIQLHSYPRSIEYRFASTTNVRIANNLVNKPIGARDGATAVLTTNVENANAAWFVNAAAGNMHLSQSVSSVVDAGTAVAGLTDDIDGEARPQGSRVDIGADEWIGLRPSPPTGLQVH